jgi:hypothetical protein
VGEPVYRPNDVPARLAAIERQLREITDRLDELRPIRDQLDDVRSIGERLTDINANLATIAGAVDSDPNRRSR